MSCCGKRRKEWLYREKPANPPDDKIPVSDSYEKNRPGSFFEYTGSRSLTIRGSISGNIYYFRFRGDRLKVSGKDAWALMAERELKYISKAGNL